MTTAPSRIILAFALASVSIFSCQTVRHEGTSSSAKSNGVADPAFTIDAVRNAEDQLFAELRKQGERVATLPCRSVQGISGRGRDCFNSEWRFSMRNSSGLKTHLLTTAQGTEKTYFRCNPADENFRCFADPSSGPGAGVDPEMPMVRLVKVVTTRVVSAQFINPMDRTSLGSARCESVGIGDGDNLTCKSEAYEFSMVNASGLRTNTIRDVAKGKIDKASCNEGTGTLGPDVEILFECYADAP